MPGAQLSQCFFHGHQTRIDFGAGGCVRRHRAGAVAVMSALLPGISPTNAVTFMAAAAGLIVVALVACHILARRATRVDPLVALR
jgi:hypothetical protein